MNNKCFYCEKLVYPALKAASLNDLQTKDHVIPKSKGGGNNPLNIVVACYNCNNIKGNLSLEEFALRISGALQGFDAHFKQTPNRERLSVIHNNILLLINKIEPYKNELYGSGERHKYKSADYFRRLKENDESGGNKELAEILKRNTEVFKKKVDKEKNNAWVYNIPDQSLSEQEYRIITKGQPSFHYL